MVMSYGVMTERTRSWVQAAKMNFLRSRIDIWSYRTNAHMPNVKFFKYSPVSSLNSGFSALLSSLDLTHEVLFIRWWAGWSVLKPRKPETLWVSGSPVLQCRSSGLSSSLPEDRDLSPVGLYNGSLKHSRPIFTNVISRRHVTFHHLAALRDF